MNKNMRDAVITTACTITAMVVAYILIIMAYD